MKINLGIIDSGATYELLSKYDFSSVTLRNFSNNKSEMFDEIGHGTAVLDTILKGIYTRNISLFVYKLFSDSISLQNSELLDSVFESAITDNIHLLNCSFGSINHDIKDELVEPFRKIVSKGTVIVSSFNDEGYSTYPALFDGVISVKSGEQKEFDTWFWEESDKDHFIFRGTKQRVKWTEGKSIFLGGSSLAAGLCTRQLLMHATENNLELTQPSVENFLKANSADKIKVSQSLNSLINWNSFFNKMNEVILYPFNKEMQPFVRYANNLPYKINWIGDHPRSKNINKNTTDLLSNCDIDFSIKNWLPENPGTSDTLIIGYLDKVSELYKKDYLIDCLKYALEHKLNVFSLLPPEGFQENQNKFNEKGLWLEVPFLNTEMGINILEKIPEKKAIDTPIVGIVGTSSIQGKFTFQLGLKYYLEKLGYKVGFISTEHQAGCFGANFTFPNGYGQNISLQIPMDFHIPILRKALSELDKLNYDIIIVGIQSGLLNEHYYYYGNIYSEIFFTACLPDNSVLIYNESDTPELIERTRKYVKAKTGQNILTELSFDVIKQEPRAFDNYIKIVADKLING
jgi:uncharacterized NAD-dependent epimerase/dehydratase family protein